MTDTLAEFGLNVCMHPWLFVRGSRRTLPWAAKQFDKAKAAPKVAPKRREAFQRVLVKVPET